MNDLTNDLVPTRARDLADGQLVMHEGAPWRVTKLRKISNDTFLVKFEDGTTVVCRPHTLFDVVQEDQDDAADDGEWDYSWIPDMSTNDLLRSLNDDALRGTEYHDRLVDRAHECVNLEEGEDGTWTVE